MKMKLLIIAGCLMLSACSTLKPTDFDRRSASEEQFERDGASCHFETYKAITYTEEYDPMLTACMRSKGYTLKDSD